MSNTAEGEALIAAVFNGTYTPTPASHADLVILVRYMLEDAYTAEDIVYAVEKPWKFTDVLADAKAALGVRR
jgi:hypothetical protein